MRAMNKMKRGFTLVELMIVVAIVGVLAALAIYGVRKYVLNAKTAEARNALGQMAKDASTAYNRENMTATIMTLGEMRGSLHRLCDSAKPVPAGKVPVAEKYQPSPADWASGSQTEGWQCLHFSMQEPHYYQYDYQATQGGTGTFTAIARGNLDGDADTSTFSIEGKVDTSGGEAIVVIAPTLSEVHPEE